MQRSRFIHGKKYLKSKHGKLESCRDYANKNAITWTALSVIVLIGIFGYT